MAAVLAQLLLQIHVQLDKAVAFCAAFVMLLTFCFAYSSLLSVIKRTSVPYCTLAQRILLWIRIIEAITNGNSMQTSNVGEQQYCATLKLCHILRVSQYQWKINPSQTVLCFASAASSHLRPRIWSQDLTLVLTWGRHDWSQACQTQHLTKVKEFSKRLIYSWTPWWKMSCLTQDWQRIC